MRDHIGHKLVIGKVYEFYAPAAKLASKACGIVWGDDKGFSFIYGGTVTLGGVLNICTPNITYNPDVIGESACQGGKELAEAFGGNYPLCPARIAHQFVRPVTGE